MIAAWMLYSSAVSVLLFIAASSGEIVLRALGGATRIVWVGAMCAALALSAAALIRRNDEPRATVVAPAATAAPQTISRAPEEPPSTNRSFQPRRRLVLEGAVVRRAD